MTEMDNVSIKVIEDARNVRSQNIREAEDKTADIIAEAAKKIKQRKNAAKAEAEAHYKKTFDMEVFKAKSELDQKILLVKLEIVDGIITKTQEKLAGLDKKGWEKFLKKMVNELDISSGSYTIGKKEKILDDKTASIIKGVKPDRKKADFDKGLKITSGKAEIMLSPENYLNMDVEDLKMEIASFLFGGGQ